MPAMWRGPCISQGDSIMPARTAPPHVASQTTGGSKGNGQASRIVLRTAVAALGMTGIAAGVVGGLSGLVTYLYARSRGVWGSGEPPEGGFEDVTFPSAQDRTPICGWYLPAGVSSAPSVILCHGVWTGRRECLPLALRFQRAGFNVLTFDFRAHGTSGGRFTSLGLHETNDVLGAVHFLKSRPEVDSTRIGVIGFSMGAAASILAAARCHDIAALVADSSYAVFADAVRYSFRRVGHLPHYPFAPIAMQWARLLIKAEPRLLRPIDMIGRIAPRPVFIVHGEDDDIVPVRHAYLLFKAAGEPKDLWVEPKAWHVGPRDMLPDRYFERVHAFMADALAPARLVQFPVHAHLPAPSRAA